MQEVVINLQMLTPSLGCVEKRLQGGHGVVYTMLRDADKNVMFLPTWWRTGMLYAANVLNMHHTLVPAISWSSRVDGTVQTWRRNLITTTKRRNRYALHEAFRPKTTISVKAVLPNGLSIEEFKKLLTIMGEYKGVSPYHTATDSFGLFVVQSVAQATTAR